MFSVDDLESLSRQLSSFVDHVDLLLLATYKNELKPLLFLGNAIDAHICSTLNIDLFGAKRKSSLKIDLTNGYEKVAYGNKKKSENFSSEVFWGRSIFSYGH